MSLSLQIQLLGPLHYHKTHDLTPVWVCVLVCECVGHFNLCRFLGITPDTYMLHVCTPYTHTRPHTHTHLKGGGIDFTQKAPIQSYLLDLPNVNTLKCVFVVWLTWMPLFFLCFVLFYPFLLYPLCLLSVFL